MSWREPAARWWRSVFSLNGRSNRLQFLTVYFELSIVGFIPLFAGYEQTGLIRDVVFITSLALIVVVGAAAVVRRGHDLGWPARLSLGLVFGGLSVSILGKAINVVGLEVAGLIVCNLTVFALLLALGDVGPNRFGPAPHVPPR